VKMILGMIVIVSLLAGCSERKPVEEPPPVVLPSREVTPSDPAMEPVVAEPAPDPEPDPEPAPEPQPLPRWEEIGRFGPNTMVWIDKDAVEDDALIAEILGQILEKHGERIVVRFFDDKRRTPRRAMMSNAEMLHMVGEYDGFRSTFYSRVEITNRNTTPPQYRLIETDIEPSRTQP